MVWKPKKQVPRVVIGHRDQAFAAWLGRQLEPVGWEFVAVDSAAKARVLARADRTVALFLDVDLQDESGWLTCDKVTHERPDLCVVLLSKDTRPEKQRFADVRGRSCTSASATGGGLLAAGCASLPRGCTCLSRREALPQ
ncbi:MAG TPA: response regulator [Gemmataceae bacterium]|nr:response regulator [Gemmataceae bacterium]